MRILIVILSLFIINISFCQKTNNFFLENEGVITYGNNSEGALFTVSFKGDSINISGEEPILFMIDSAAIQIISWPITEGFHYPPYDSISEFEVLASYWEQEFDYLQTDIYKRQLECTTESFTNNYSKNILMKYIAVPEDIKYSTSVDVYNILTLDEIYLVDYNIYILFTTNSHITMISMPVYVDEALSDKIEIIKSQIANSIRIYSGYIDVGFLDYQIYYKLRDNSFIVADTIHGVQYTIPYWLNIGMYNRPYLIGTFPDIDNISNALALTFIPKTDYNSYDEFLKYNIRTPNMTSYERVDSQDTNLQIFKVKSIFNAYEFYNQNVFMETKNHYMFLNFTSTKSTYDINLPRFNEFVNSIKRIEATGNSN